MSGVCYESTPDGRPGWEMNFLNGGYSVFIADTTQTGRSPSAKFPELTAPPTFRAKSFLWEIFRIGPPGSYNADPALRRNYPDSRFPFRDFDAFARRVFPRFHPSNDEEQSQFASVLKRVGPCFIVAHSSAGQFALRVARDSADLVRGIAVIEPTGGIDPSSADIDRLRRTPQLFVWGDHLDQDQDWRDEYASARKHFEAFKAAGARSWTEGRRIVGNSHMLMMDDNSRDIAERVVRWISSISAAPLAGGGLSRR